MKNALLEMLQAASNSAASNISGPVDLLSAGLRKAGVPVPFDSFGSSQWMAQRGLTREVNNPLLRLVGETAGMTAPIAIAAKAPQLAAIANQAAQNAYAPRMPGAASSQRGAIITGGSNKLTADEYNDLINLVSKIEKEAEKRGSVFVRWSPTASKDLKPGAVSRDFVSGQTHAGLSAVEVTGDMHPVDIAKALREYGFLRMQDNRSVPRVYGGQKVGIDSDGHASIIANEVLFSPNKKQINALDKKFADAYEASDNIKRYKSRIERGATMWQSDVDKETARLQKLIDFDLP
jgi:hypothetical protein